MTSEGVAPREVANPGVPLLRANNPGNAFRPNPPWRKHNRSYKHKSPQQHSFDERQFGNDRYLPGGFGGLPTQDISNQASVGFIAQQQQLVSYNELNQFFAWKQSRHDDQLGNMIMMEVEKLIDQKLQFVYDQLSRAMHIIDNFVSNHTAPSVVETVPDDAQDVIFPESLASWGLAVGILAELKQNPRLLIDGVYMRMVFMTWSLSSLQKLHKKVFSASWKGPKEALISILVDRTMRLARGI